MKYIVEMGSGAMIYMPSSIKIGSDIQKLMGGGRNSKTHRQHGYHISLLYFLFLNKASGLNMKFLIVFHKILKYQTS
jgi:hypothetical protein